MAQEDHARRAVLAAIALLQRLCEALEVHGQPQGEPSAVCLGIHTGHVVVGRLGGEPQRLYTASGETVQLAVRLRQLAEPGAILISATTQLPNAMMQEIVAKADGNPFFLEELAWYAVEHRGEHELLQVPDTIETVLAERIDRLPADDKRLLQMAAVVGKDVPLPLLQASEQSCLDLWADGAG